MLAERDITTDGYLNNKVKMLKILENKVKKLENEIIKSRKKDNELKNNWWENFWRFSKSEKENKESENQIAVPADQDIKVEDMVVERKIKVA